MPKLTQVDGTEIEFENLHDLFNYQAMMKMLEAQIGEKSATEFLDSLCKKGDLSGGD